MELYIRTQKGIWYIYIKLSYKELFLRVISLLGKKDAPYIPTIIQ